MVTPSTPKTVNAAKLVPAAIGELKDGGASKDEITQHLETELALSDKDVGKYLNKAIDNGNAFGAIKRLQGRYYLGEAVDGIREHCRRRRSSKGGRRRRRRRRSH